MFIDLERLERIANSGEKISLAQLIYQGKADTFGTIKEYPRFDVENEDHCLFAVKHHASLLKLIPINYQTMAICKQALESNPFAIKYCNIRHLETKEAKELCLFAVKQDGMTLEFCDHINEEIAIEAVKQNGKAIKFVPLGYKTEDVILEAVKQDGYALGGFDGFALDKNKQTPNVCLEAIKQNPWSIRFVHKENKTKELCDLALSLDPRAKEFI